MSKQKQRMQLDEELSKLPSLYSDEMDSRLDSGLSLAPRDVADAVIDNLKSDLRQILSPIEVDPSLLRQSKRLATLVAASMIMDGQSLSERERLRVSSGYEHLEQEIYNIELDRRTIGEMLEESRKQELPDVSDQLVFMDVVDNRMSVRADPESANDRLIRHLEDLIPVALKVTAEHTRSAEVKEISASIKKRIRQLNPVKSHLSP